MAARIASQGGSGCALRRCAPLVLGLLFASSAFAAEDTERTAIELPIPHFVSETQNPEAVLTAGIPADPGHATGNLPSSPSVRRRPTIDERVKLVKRPSSSKATRKAAIAALPLARMSEPNRQRVVQIVNGTSIFRELPACQFAVDPRVYRFFMDHPEVAVGIWRVMKISEFRMRQTGPTTFETDDGGGTSGAIDVVYRSENEVVAVCDGVYKSPLLLSPIRATGALHVQVGFERRADGKTYATHTARVFVSFPSQTMDTAARIMSPVSYGVIDQNLREVSLFLHMMSMAMQRQPGWVEFVANRLDGVAAPRKTQLMELTVAVYVDANPGLRRMHGRAEHETKTKPEASSATNLRGHTASREEIEMPLSVDPSKQEPNY